MINLFSVPPTIEGLPSELTAVEDTDIVLRCSASGTPQPTVRWLRFGRQIDADQRKYVVMDNGSLAILNVKESDSGDYTCMATNDIGRPAVKTVTVNFQGTPFVFKGSMTIFYSDINCFVLCVVNKRNM
jgi:roundabout axon guidance receptor 2